MFFKRFVFLSVIVIAITGCDQDSNVTEFNKSSFYWYQQIAKTVSNTNLDKADNYYISLKSEHPQSPYLRTSMMILADAHYNNEEYLLSNFYLEEYNKHYGDLKTKTYIDFLRLKLSFYKIQNVNRDQKLIEDTIIMAKEYKQNYTNSKYIPLVDSMLIRLYMSQYLLNENIAALYDRVDKPKAAQIYRDKNKDSIVNMQDIKLPKKSFINQILD